MQAAGDSAPEEGKSPREPGSGTPSTATVTVMTYLVAAGSGVDNGGLCATGGGAHSLLHGGLHGNGGGR